jgi:nucleotide-binding universal stress UspA family protein
MKRILVPTDFSNFAFEAAKTAADIAKKTNSELVFLHVVTMPNYESGVLPYQDNSDFSENLFILKLVKQNFQKLLAAEFLQGLKVTEAISYSSVYESITENIESHSIDLIVMGTHGASGYVNDFFIGSNTDKVVRKSTIPVIAVKSHGDTNFDRVLFAGDFSDAMEKNFDFIKSFTELYSAEIMLLHVVTKGEFYYTVPMLKRIEDFAKNKALTNYSCHVFNAESIQTGINEFAQLNKIKLISTITSGRKGLSRLLNGSITEDIMHAVSLPVLTVKNF